MVTSVKGSALAALLAQENPLTSRAPTPQAPANGQAGPSPTQDPAVVYSGASGAPSLAAVLSLQDSLNRAASIADVGVSGAKTIADLVAQARAKAVSALTTSDPTARAALEAQYQQLLQTIDGVAGSAAYQGVNLLTGEAAADASFNAGLGNDATVSLTPQDLTTAGLGLAGTSLLGASDDLVSVLSQVDAASGTAAAQLSALTGQSDQIQAQLGVVGQLQNVLGRAGQPDLSTETARLQALSAQQMLSGEGSSLANQAPSALLSLFR